MNHGTSSAGFSILKKYTPFASKVLILREINCNQWRNHISLLSSFFLVSIFTVHESHENGSMDSRQYNVLRLNVWFRLLGICYRKYSPEEILLFFFFFFITDQIIFVHRTSPWTLWFRFGSHPRESKLRVPFRCCLRILRVFPAKRHLSPINF